MKQYRSPYGNDNLNTLHGSVGELPRPVLQRSHVAIRAQPADNSRRFIVEIAVMAPRFARMHIGHMALNERDAHAEQSITDSDRRVREATRVNDDGVDALLAGLLDAVHDAALVIGLEGEDAEAQLGAALLDRGVDLGERDGAVDLGLARAQEVEVGPVDEEDLLAGGGGRFGHAGGTCSVVGCVMAEAVSKFPSGGSA